MCTSLVVAASRNEVIGRGQDLPWHLPEDLRHFKKLTTGHPVIMGRITHQSIVARLGRPLTGRISVVISSHQNAGSDDAVRWVQSVDSAIAKAREVAGGHAVDSEIFVIGGASVYRQTLKSIDKIYLTRVHHDIDGDSSLPGGWLEGFRLVARDDRPSGPEGYSYSFLEYVRS